MKGRASYVIRKICVIGGDVSCPPGLEIALQELNPRFDTRTYLEVLLIGPPRRARGKLSKRITRIREGANPGALGTHER